MWGGGGWFCVRLQDKWVKFRGGGRLCSPTSGPRGQSRTGSVGGELY